MLRHSIRQFAISLLRKTIAWPPLPMTPDRKREVILSYTNNQQDLVFVESGTFRGDTVAAMRPFFRELVSIELFAELYLAAYNRFEGDEKVKIVHGDSGEVLPLVVNHIEGPIIYWLDGHYSGAGTASSKDTECPIIAELDAIIGRGNPKDVILIDDARLFGWRPGYPGKRILKEIVSKQLPAHALAVVEDIIVIHPKDLHPVKAG